MSELSEKYKTAEECIKAAKKAQKQIRKTKFDEFRDEIALYGNETTTYYGHKYTVNPYGNQLINKDVAVDDNYNILITSTYKDKEGYTCTVYQNQLDDSVKKITVNRPNGDKNTEITLSPATLKNDMVKDQSITPFLESMNVLVETGASMKEMYQEYNLFSVNGRNEDHKEGDAWRKEQDLALSSAAKDSTHNVGIDVFARIARDMRLR